MNFRRNMHLWFEWFFWIFAAFVVGITVSFIVIKTSSGVMRLASNAGHFIVQKVKSIKLPNIRLTGTTNIAHSDVQVVVASSTADLSDSEDAVTAEVSNAVLYTLKFPTTNLKVTAKAYLIGDVDTGKIIAENNGTTIYPIASVSKLMTIVVSKKSDNLQDVATISKSAVATYGTQGELYAGEKIMAGDLEYPLLLKSSNDAAEALAEHYGLTAFIKLMNQKALELGMKQTSYSDPSGLTPKNVSTVEDLFKLAHFVFKNHPDIFNTTRVRQYSILHHTWTNANHFLALDSFAGGKNGFTDEALQTTVSLFNVKLGNANGGDGGNHTIAIVLLRSSSREGDVYTILNYIRHNVQFEGATSTTATSTSAHN